MSLPNPEIKLSSLPAPDLASTRPSRHLRPYPRLSYKQRVLRTLYTGLLIAAPHSPLLLTSPVFAQSGPEQQNEQIVEPQPSLLSQTDEVAGDIEEPIPLIIEPTLISTPEATPIPKPPLVFRFGADISDSDQQLIRHVASWTQNHWEESTGSITVYAFSNVNTLLDAYTIDCLCIPSSNLRTELQLPNHFTTTAPGVLLILASPRGTWGESTNNTKIQAITHSHFHAIQSLWSKWGVEPIWMAEGNADYSMTKVRSLNGFESFSDMLTYYKNQARFALTPLRNLETWQQDVHTLEQGEPYTLGFLATDMLATKYGEKSILAFWKTYGEALRADQTWQFAFQNTFGISENEFYNQFETQRASRFPPLTCKNLQNPNFTGTLILEYCGSIDPYPTGSVWRSYIFCVAGFDLSTLTSQHRINALILPKGGYFYDYVPTTHTNCEGVFIQDGTTSGSLNVTFKTPDGPSATASFIPR